LGVDAQKDPPEGLALIVVGFWKMFPFVIKSGALLDNGRI
jgi:hypothetical protein